MRTHRHVWIARRAIDLVMLVILIAGALKAFDITHFVDALRTWSLLPVWAPLLLAPVIPAIEIGIALAWFLRITPRLAAVAAAVLLISFTSFYGVHLLQDEAPACGCLGLLEAFKSSINESVFAVSRNAVLVGLLGLAAALNWRAGASREAAAPQALPSANSGA